MADEKSNKTLTVSELIQRLTTFKDQFGDLPVWFVGEGTGDIVDVRKGQTNTGKELCGIYGM